MFLDDADSFFDTDEGATTVTIDGGDPVSARFLRQWVEVNVGNVQLSGINPTLFALYSDFSGKRGSTVVADSTNYTVVDIQPDNEAIFATVILKGQ